MTPGFSVVIPAYNYGHCIARAVNSVLEQRYENLEVLVINDGSTDNTDTVMTSMVNENSSRLRYQKQENRGLSLVRNRGIAESRKEWLIFLDADDEMLPGALERYAEIASEHSLARLLIGGHLSCSSGEDVLVEPVPTGNQQKNFSAYLDKKLSISNGACAMHRELFSRVRYDGALRHTEDIPVFAHVLANFSVVSFVSPVARIYKHADSMRHDVDAAMAVGLNLEDAIFVDNGLPDWALCYRKAYRTHRIQSLLKICHRAGRYAEVRALYWQLFASSPVTALNLRYLRRLVSSLGRA